MGSNFAYTWEMAGSVKAHEMAVAEIDDAASARAGLWPALTIELDAWAASGRVATLWWRDDDATRSGERLSRLLDIAGATPLTLAVIPASARDDLAPNLADHVAAGGHIAVVQHGYAHLNHAPPAEKKAEYGPHRPAGEMIDELANGREILESMFGDMFLPVLTPPWNRIAPALASRIGEAGLRGLSAFGRQQPRIGATVVNTHIDIIDWRGSRGYAGETAVLGAIISHLRARRTGEAELAIPTGILTHHRDHDEASWRFLHRFVAHVANHVAARWIHGFAGDRGMSA